MPNNCRMMPKRSTDIRERVHKSIYVNVVIDHPDCDCHAFGCLNPFEEPDSEDFVDISFHSCSKEADGIVHDQDILGELLYEHCVKISNCASDFIIGHSKHPHSEEEETVQ
jgi:hypothetical protein